MSPRSQRRRDEIIDAASTLFSKLGYHRVGIDDVAGEVGITGGAIYKHFGGKQDLLRHAVDGALRPVEAAVLGATDLDAAIEALAVASTDQRRIGLLLTREVRALEGDEGHAAFDRIDRVRSAISALVGVHRADDDEVDARLLGDAVLTLSSSPAQHAVVLPRPQSIAFLTEMGRRAIDVELPPRSPSADSPAFPSRRATMLVDRRDLLIDAAIDLFGRRGYWAATMDDLGAAADISGPSIYQHFPSKADLLVAVFTRGNEGLRLGLSRAFDEGYGAGETLGLLVDSYVDFVLAHPGVNRLLMNEQMYLPELERASVRGMQHRYVGEWVNLLQQAQPELEQRPALFLIHAVLGMVNNRGPRQPGDGNRPAEVLTAVARALLLTPAWAELTS